jgi:hypothetical protein
MMFEVIALPTLPSLSDAPIIAIDVGERKTDSANLILVQFSFHNKAIHVFRIKIVVS